MCSLIGWRDPSLKLCFPLPPLNHHPGWYTSPVQKRCSILYGHTPHRTCGVGELVCTLVRRGCRREVLRSCCVGGSRPSQRTAWLGWGLHRHGEIYTQIKISPPYHPLLPHWLADQAYLSSGLSSNTTSTTVTWDFPRVWGLLNYVPTEQQEKIKSALKNLHNSTWINHQNYLLYARQGAAGLKLLEIQIVLSHHLISKQELVYHHHPQWLNS